MSAANSAPLIIDYDDIDDMDAYIRRTIHHTIAFFDVQKHRAKVIPILAVNEGAPW